MTMLTAGPWLALAWAWYIASLGIATLRWTMLCPCPTNIPKALVGLISICCGSAQ